MRRDRAGGEMERIVLAYSGGLDTSVAIPWLAETYGAEVIAVTLEPRPGRESRRGSRARAGCRARSTRTSSTSSRSSRRSTSCPALQAGAIYEDRYPLATALGRPLIASKLVEVAHLETGRRHRPRLHRQGQRPGALRRVGAGARPDHEGVAPARVWGMTRADEIDYARGARHPGAGHEEEPLQHRREPVGPFDRVRHPRGPVGGAARGRLSR